jgi:hypothetical protein
MEEQQEIQQKEHTHTRRVAHLFADECISALIHRMTNNKDSKFIVDLEHDSLDLTVRDDRDTLTVRTAEDLTLPLEELQEIQIEVSIRGDPECDGLELEAFTYLSDDIDLTRDAIVSVSVTIPLDWSDMDVLHSEIRAALVHEIRHAVQHCVWDWRPSVYLDDLEASDHLTSNHEIDARVEEICSYSTLTMSEMTSNTFSALARKYLRDYISRNGLDDSPHLIEDAVMQHISHWHKRSKADEFSRPA